ncbi:mucin-5B-like [Discoglossus pictus]
MALRYSLLVLMLGLSALMVNGQTTTQKTTSQSSGQTTPNTTSAQLNASEADCGENKFYNECGSRCPPNCTHFNPPPVCSKDCVKGCFCKDGFVEDEARNCIPQIICKGCTGNTTFSSCKTRCPESCNGRDNQACALPCYTGCICKPNYIRTYWENDHEGPCVLPIDCPKKMTKY